MTCGRRSGWRRRVGDVPGSDGMLSRFAPPGQRRPPVARARRTFCAAGPRTVADRACAAYGLRRGPRTAADRARTAYVSRRRATNGRRPGAHGVPLASRDHRSAPERRLLALSDGIADREGGKAPVHGRIRCQTSFSRGPACAERAGRTGLACTRLHQRPPRSRIDSAPTGATPHPARLVRSSTCWCEVGNEGRAVRGRAVAHTEMVRSRMRGRAVRGRAVTHTEMCEVGMRGALRM